MYPETVEKLVAMAQVIDRKIHTAARQLYRS
jgi:hypothetical protein